MNLFDFDGVESEKAYTMKRYNDRRNYLAIFRVTEAVVAVSLLGYWCLPSAMISLETAGDWLRRIAAIVDNHAAVFVLVNVLVIWILYLSREKSETKLDLYDQYTSAAAATAVVYPVPVVRDDSRDKQIVPVKSRIESISAADRRPEKTVAAEEDRVVCCSEEVTEVKKSSYRRTRSEMRRSSTAREVRRVEYRRSSSSSSATAERVTAWGSREVEGLSSEEFRVTVERFIMETKRTLRQENDAVVVPRRGHSRHLTNSSNRSSCSALVRV